MTEEEVKAEIYKLTREIKFYNKSYFEQSLSLISDYEYDCLVARLTELEEKYPHLKRDDSPNNSVDEVPTEGFVKYAHTTPMLSLKKTYSNEDVIGFIKEHPQCSFICELKLDGISINVNYKKGYFSSISTRGDGHVGDDITCNKNLFKNIPQFLEEFKDVESVDLRGEALMTYDSFSNLNSILKAAGKNVLANPRNAASGMLKSLPKDNEDEEKQQFITAYFYDIYFENRLSWFKTRIEMMDLLKKIRIPVEENYEFCKEEKEVISYINKINTKRYDVAYPTDGVVIKINELENNDIYGATNKHPRWAIAFKYKPTAVSSRLLTVEYQVGRSGLVTPIAVFEPVILAGTVVQRASLYNKQNIENLDLHEQDYIFIQKSGEIIPRVINVDKQKRNLNNHAVKFVKDCPCCGSSLRFENELCYCDNKQCKGRIISSLTHFVSKQAMDIRSLGPKIISLLVERGLLKNYKDIYNLRFKDVYQLPGMNMKSTEKLFKEIDKSRQQPFYKILFALGIEGVGEVAARNIAQKYNNMEQLQKATLEDLMKINLIGEGIARNVVNYFS